MQSSITEIHNSRFFLKRILSLAAKTKRRYYDVEKTSIYGLIGTLAYSGWVPIIGTLATAFYLDQRESEVGVNLRGNFWVQLFLVNFIVLITNPVGDRTEEGAFSQKTPNYAQKCRKKADFISKERLVVWASFRPHVKQKDHFSFVIYQFRKDQNNTISRKLQKQPKNAKKRPKMPKIKPISYL